MWNYTPDKLDLFIKAQRHWRKMARIETLIDTTVAIGAAFGGKLDSYIETLEKEE